RPAVAYFSPSTAAAMANDLVLADPRPPYAPRKRTDLLKSRIGTSFSGSHVDVSPRRHHSSCAASISAWVILGSCLVMLVVNIATTAGIKPATKSARSAAPALLLV